MLSYAVRPWYASCPKLSILGGVRTDRVQLVDEVQAFGTTHDPDSGRRCGHGLVDLRELERDRLLPADDAITAPLEVCARRRVTLARLALELVPVGCTCERADLSEDRGTDTEPPRVRHDDEMGLRVFGHLRVHEPAGNRLPVESRDEVHEPGLDREHMAQVLDARRRAVRIRRRAHGDHPLEVGVCLDVCDREPGGHGRTHVKSSFSGWALRVEPVVAHRHHLPGASRDAGLENVAIVTAVSVKVKLFAGLRELAGWGEKELENVTRVDELWPVLGLGPEPKGLLYAVNKEYATRDRELHDGDEVALIPPVSGGDFRLSDEGLSLDAVVAEVGRDEAGAIATFTGTTRVHSRGRTVTHLEYEAYAGMAERVMAEIAGELHGRYEVCEIAIHHRTGRVEIGEPSVVIAVSAPHRQDALAACKDAIDQLKERVPLWKKEVYEGGEEWIGRGS